MSHGAGVTDMIAEAIVARKLETGHEILKSIHPTMSEAVMEAVADAYGECTTCMIEGTV
jgi:dihydrolipoamide dehydrogenase